MTLDPAGAAMPPTHGTPGPPPLDDAELVPRAVHVWVTDVQVWGDRQAPGVLLGWKRSSSSSTGWVGWVIAVHLGTEARGDGPYVRQGWVDAAKIRRVEGAGAP